MRLQRIVRALALCVLVSSLCGRAIAAQKLEAFAGVIGGAPNGPNAAANIPGSCSTYGSAAPIFSFFGSSSLLSVPQGGIAFCGYSGDMNDQTATAGPLTATQTLGPTILGNPGYAGYFNGSADATADFWTLKAAAHGQISGGVEGTTLALNGSAAAAFFEDTFTQTSLPPSIGTSSPGFVRYTFHFGGSLNTPTVPISYSPAAAVAILGIQHSDGSGTIPGTFSLVSVNAGAGGIGAIRSYDGNTAGFLPGPSSISGAGTFTSAYTDIFGIVRDFPITFGTPFSVKAGLLASVSGTGDSSFLSTATLTRIELFDTLHNPLETFTLTGASGKVYSTAPADAIPPATTATPSPGPNGNGWNNTNVTVALNATDNSGGSGVKEIQFSLSGAQSGGSVVSGNAAAVTVSAAGVTTLTYFARDHAGNQQTAKTLTIQIDTTTPAATAAASPKPNANGWNNTNVTISFAGTDSLSGIDVCTGAITLLGEGNGLSASGTCTDKAGNVSTPVVVNGVNIDRTPPTLTFGTPTPAPNAGGWNNTNVTLSFTAADDLSGVVSRSVPSPLALTTEGPSLTGMATLTDGAGNTATFTSPAVKIDKTPPVITATLSPLPNANGWNKENVTTTFSALDVLSGIKTATNPITTTTDGAGQLVTGTAIDLADNVSSVTVKLNIDKTPPEVYAQFDPATKSVLTFGRDLVSGVPPGPVNAVCAATASGKNKDHKGPNNAYLCTYSITDLAGNILSLVEKVKQSSGDKDGHALKLRIMSTRYNGSPAVDAGSNHASFDWSVNKDGALKEFDQAIVMGRGTDRSAITAKFNAKQSQTTIETNGSKQSKVVKPGLVLLRLTTNKGVLGVEY